MRQQVATVPSQTVQEGPDGDYAYVIDKDDTVERRPVEVADGAGRHGCRHQGIDAGEHVVVDGQYRLTEGARVSLRQPSRCQIGQAESRTALP